MLKKRIYCMDDELCGLEKEFVKIDEESDKLLKLIMRLERDVEHWTETELPTETWKYLLHRLDKLEDAAYRHSMNCYHFQNDMSDVSEKRCKWRRIPPIKFWRKKES